MSAELLSNMRNSIAEIVLDLALSWEVSYKT